MTDSIRITAEFIKSFYKPIAVSAHKGTQGHVLIIGGSYGKIGSMSLSGKAALKSGSGLVSVFIPKCGYDIVQMAVPELMVITDAADHFIEHIHFLIQPKAIGIGMGLGQENQTQIALHRFLKQNTIPLVIDADALNILSLHPDWFKLLPENSILTPHPKELERLIGVWKSSSERDAKVMAFSKEYRLIVVMKGAPTCVIDGALYYQNTTGNQALATAGSGDVLSGIITSLLGQGYTAIHAALLGVYLHGLTADIAVPTTGFQSFIASDCIANLGKAYLSLEQS